MHTPSREAFGQLARRGNLVPVYRQLMGDLLTPVLAFVRLAGDDRQAFLLESVTGGEKIGRYSFLGLDPEVVIRATETETTIHEPQTGKTRTATDATPLDTLDALLAEYEPVPLPDLPRFTGGAVGYFAYDVVRQVEHLPNAPERSMGLPDIYFGIYRTMLVFDHVNKTCKVVAHADLREDDPETAYARAVARIDAMVEKLRAPGELPVDEAPAMPTEEPVVDSNFAREDFEASVEKCKEYIRAGDAFQIVLSQRLSMPCAAPPFEIYRALRVINPSPYMFYLQYPDFQLIGCSPEVMVRVEGRKITLRPIAGTRRRGKDEAEDKALAEDLLADPKERAEHSMLVDLGRNDVGRVAEYGSVELTEAMIIENYSHVMHIVSNVEGTLRENLTALDALKACFPAGTVSGAPKVRAMEIIDELEPDKRGPYAGAVGYVDFGGNMDTCITLRTMLLKEKRAYVQAGAGIVADSVPASEYVETFNKAKALLRAIQIMEAGGAD